MKIFQVKQNVLVILFTLVFLQITYIANAQVSGTVYRDLPVNGSTLNTYGVKDVNEYGVEGVTVTIYPGGVTTTTAADGTYSIAGVNGAVRVEFSDWPSYLNESPDGGGVNTSIQFVTAPASNVNFGLHESSDFAGTTADIAMTFQVNNSGAETDLFTVRILRNNDVPGVTVAGIPTDGVSDNNGAQGDQPTNGDKVSFINETGSIWGTAFNRKTKDVYVSSFVRRYTALGPNGMGAIYKIDNANNVTLFTTVANTGTLTANADRDLSDVSTEASHDPIFNEVGRLGLGDLDISVDGKTLYTVNVNTNEFVTIEIANPTNQNIYQIGNPFGAGCPDGDVKSWGIGQNSGKIYVGSTCTSNLTQGAYISEFNGLSFTALHQIPLDMQGETSVGSGPNHLNGERWRTWAVDPVEIFDPTLPESGGIIRYSFPAPLLSDIVFDENEGMILGFIDRTAMQSGHDNYSPIAADTKVYRCDAAGDIYRVCNVDGVYYNEGTPECPQQPARTTPTTYYEDYPEYFGGEEWNPYHGENALGGIAYQQGADRVLLTSFDPVERGYDGEDQNHSNSGIEWLNTVDGERTSGIRMAGGGYLRFPYGGKAGGIGDIEYLNAPAPVEIGNLVWEDTDGDGIQDPDESGISGVEVKLFQGAVELATATTDANGHYIFSNDPNGITTASHIYNISQLVDGGIDYMVVIEDVNGVNKQAALGTNNLTSSNIGEGSNDNKNDSDGDENGTRAEVNVLPADIPVTGANNHSFDFGFSATPPPPVCSISESHYSECSDNETMGDDTDDYFDLTVTGTTVNGSGSYIVIIGGYTSPITPSGNSVTIVGNGQGGNPLLAADGATTYTVTVEDANDSSCSTVFTTDVVNSCSNCPTPNCGSVTIQKN